jgi:hypothetical protein
MKSRRIHSFVVALTLFWSVVIVSAQGQAPAPTYKEGDTWRFKFENKGIELGRTSTDILDGIFEVAFTQGNFKLYEVEGGTGRGGEIPFYPDDRSERLLTTVGQVEKRPTLKFPLSVGQKWTYEFTARPPGSRADQKRSVEVAVLGMEDVTTPAGVFKAFKIVREEAYQQPGPRGKYARATYTYFYTPETKSTVKGSTVNDSSPTTSEYQLIKYTPGS